MNIREVLHEVLSDFTSSSLQNLKWSVSISVHWIISQLQTADIHKVMDFLQKSSEECSDLTMMILECGGVASEVPTAKSTGYTWKLFLEAQRSLTSDKYSAFLSMLEDKLEHIWKHKLEEVDQSQVVQLLKKLFCQDPIVLSLILEEMCSLNLIHVSPESSVSKRGASDAFGKLSHKEFEKLRPHLKYYLPHISLSELEETGSDGIVGLMKINSNRSCVELTEKVLKRMERTDLVSKLSQQSSALTGPWPVYYEQGPWSDESQGSFVKNRMQHVKPTIIRFTIPFTAKPLHYKMMWSNLSLLLNLSEVSWQNFQKTLPALLNVRRRGFPVDLLPREAVLWVVLQHGSQSLYKVAHVLVHMGLSGLAQQLIHSDTDIDSDSDSEDRGFLWGRGHDDWHKISNVLADLEVFLNTTVHELSFREMSHFEWFVQFTCLEEGVSWIDLECERQSQEFEMMASACTPLTAKEACAALMRAVVVKHGQHAAGFMENVFKNMNSDEIMRSVWYSRVKHQFKMGPALYQKIKEMEAVINCLMKTFGGLNTSELMDLKHALTTGEHSTIPWHRLCHYETSHLVFSIVQTYGQRSVELTKNLLESIGRIDCLTWLDSGSCDYSPYGWWYALINKVATVAAVTELLGETLSLLRSEELKRFKKLLVLETLFHPPPHVDLRLLASANAEQTGALLLHTYGQKALKTTYWILMKMKCSDVAHNLKSKMTKGKPSKPKVATVKDLRKILLKLLAGLSDEEMYEFKMRLQLRYCRMDHAWLQEREADADGLVDLIFETSGQCSLQVITDVLEKMGKSDLVIDSLEGTGLEWFLDYTDSYTSIVKSLLKENSKASADVERVQVVLQVLTGKQEEQTFKKHLQISCESNLSRRFVWNYIRIFSEAQDLVDLLVAVYGEFSSADVIQTVLSHMGRQDLMAKMSKPSVTSEGLGQRVEPDSWISAKDIWTKLEPKVQEIYSQFTYSLQSGEGQYECSVSGLRWSCEQSVSFQYRFGPWEEHLERLKELQYMPAGPLIDITVSSGRLDVVYLPHWVCVDNPDTEEKMAVLHINDSGDTLEKATEVTSSHVKLLEPIFSPRAVLIKLGFPVKIYCSLLIYKTNTAFLTLHVYLIPRDPGLKESMDRSKQHHGYSIIPKPHPDRSLKIRDQFVLKSHQETLEIDPQKLTLRYRIPPNFYEVYTENPDFDFRLELAQQNDLAPVWSCTVRQGEYTERKLAVPRPEGIHFVDKFELQLIQRVSNIAEILDHLLSAGVVSPEAYNTISMLSTPQQKMRGLFRGPLKSSGERGKDIFYKILKDKESHLCAELEGL